MVLAALAVVLGVAVVVFRADGFDAVDATVPRATRWFVHQPTGQIVLVDGFAGRALARLETTTDGRALELAQSAGGAALIDRSAGTTRSVDSSNLRLGPPQSFGLVAEPTTLVGVGQSGLVAVDRATAQAVVVPTGGEAVPFELGAAGAGELTRIAPDGSIWTLAAGRLLRVTSTGQQVIASDVAGARFTLVGNRALLFDPDRRQVRFDDGGWIDVPTTVDASEILLQEPGPRADCGWVVADDDLWCLTADGIEVSSTIAGLDADGGDRFAIAGDAGALVRRTPAQIVRIDWRAGTVLDDVVADVPAGSDLEVSTAIDLIWVDQRNGGLVWSVNPWGLRAVEKNDATTPLLGESGEVVDAGRQGSATARTDDAADTGVPEPDDNGIDDPPVANDDPVTARTGAPVPVAVTANDYDPDGEAVVLVAVGDAEHGSVDIASGTTVIYQPNSGQVGLDSFEYTIADGNGTTATATVRLELLPIDAANQAPIGARDEAETGPGADVVIDVLLNDIDPERDSLRIDSFTPPDFGGRVNEVVAPSGLPGLQFTPDGNASGTVTFTYRPIDVFGAVGEPVPVQVEIAQLTDANRPPVVRPDAARVRRGVEIRLPVMANDTDPDGDVLRLLPPTGLPPGIRVVAEGNELAVTVLAGSADLIPFSYTVDDGRGHQVVGSVLVAVIAEIEPNRAPIANADTTSAVVGRTELIDVLLNDTDPDGDPLIIVDVDADGGAAVSVQGDRIRYTAPNVASDEDAEIDRFTYTISDGNGHEADGEVTVRVLPEAIAAPPFAQDDAATTEVDVPVTLDVLRNDRDPSGERPTLVGTPGCSGIGTASVTPDSKVTYTPPPGRSGVFGCTYEVTNSQGLRASATITISVLEPVIVNDPPDVTDEQVTVLIGESIEVDVLANDVDPDGPFAELRVVSSTAPVLGQAVRDGGVIRFDAGDVAGVVAITYQVSDALGGVSSGRLVISIREPDPEPPVTLDDERTITGPGYPVPLDVLANDTDPDGDPDDLAIESAELVSGDGTLQVGVRVVTFQPDPDFVGDLVATYVVSDPTGLTATGTATLHVLEAPNRPPVANDDAGEVVNGGTVTIPIALNDADPDGDPLSFEIVQGPDAALGAARLDVGALIFDAVPGASGTATITYRVDDGEDTDDAVVSVAVLPCSVAPPDAPNVSLQTGYEQPISIDLYAWARNGEVVDVGPPLGVPQGVYTPPPGENGNVAFDYTVRNSCRIQATGRVVIDVNQDPVAAPYEANIGRIDTHVIPVSSIASDAEPLTIVGLEGAPAWVTLVDQRRAIQVVPTGQSGRLDLIAIVADPGGLQARVPIVLHLINQAPIAQADIVEVLGAPTAFAPMANDTDPDGDAITLAVVPPTFQFADGSTGTIEQLPDGRLRLDPKGAHGEASFTYTVRDQLDATSSPATVTVRVNAPPVAEDLVVVVPPGRSVTVALPAFDPDGGAITAVLGDDNVTPYEVALVGLELTVSVNGGSNPDRVLEYTVTDDRNLTAVGQITLRTDPTTTTTSSTTTTTTTTSTTTTTTTIVDPTIP